MLRSGCIVLSLWAVLNLLPSIWILVSTTFFDGDSPAVFQILDAEEVAALSAKERTSINSVAVFANGLNIAFCSTALFVVWFGLYRRSMWAFWCSILGIGSAWSAAALGDYVLGTVHPEISLLSGGILLAGIAAAAIDLFWLDRRR